MDTEALGWESLHWRTSSSGHGFWKDFPSNATAEADEANIKLISTATSLRYVSGKLPLTPSRRATLSSRAEQID